MTDAQDDEYYIPLQDQKVWGAGIKRKRVNFVPASGTAAAASSSSETIGESAASRYLSIVLKKDTAQIPHATERTNLDTGSRAPILDQHALTTSAEDRPGSDDGVCPICNAPVNDEPPFFGTKEQALRSEDDGYSAAKKPSRHESSIAHQLCLSHVHPPSHIDRTRHGAKYLTSYGWDPDARQGLGARGEGMRAPIKATVKNDTAGLGVERDQKSGHARDRILTSDRRGQGKDLRLDAGQVRKREAQNREKADRLRSMVFGDDKVAKYLGQQG